MAHTVYATQPETYNAPATYKARPRLLKITKQIRAKLTEFSDRKKHMSLLDSIGIGDLLAEARGLLPSKEFSKYMFVEFNGLASHNRLYQMEQTTRLRNHVDELEVLPITAAYIIAAPQTVDQVLPEVLKQIKRNKLPTVLDLQIMRQKAQGAISTDKPQKPVRNLEQERLDREAARQQRKAAREAARIAQQQAEEKQAQIVREESHKAFQSLFAPAQAPAPKAKAGRPTAIETAVKKAKAKAPAKAPVKKAAPKAKTVAKPAVKKAASKKAKAKA